MKEKIIITAKKSNVHKKEVKIKIAMSMDTDYYLLFEYAGKIFGMNGNFEYSPIIIEYEKKHDYPFLLSKAFTEDQMDDLLEILAIKSEGVLEGGHFYEFEEVVEGIIEVPLKLQKYIPLFPIIQIIDESLRKYSHED